MSDIFREIEEDVRRERIEKLWKAYGTYIIVLVVLVLAGVGGWQLWLRHLQQERQKVSAAFIAAQRISNPQIAANAFADIARDSPSGYRQIARLSEAGAMFAAGQRSEAIDLYKEIAHEDTGPIGAVARLRAAWGLADTASRSAIGQLLAPLTDPGSAWHANAGEILAYADYRALDMKSAQQRYAALAIDPQSPDSLRARAKAMAEFIKAGGARNFGTVPADQPPSIPAPHAAQNPAPPSPKPAPSPNR